MEQGSQTKETGANGPKNSSNFLAETSSLEWDRSGVSGATWDGRSSDTLRLSPKEIPHLS